MKTPFKLLHLRLLIVLWFTTVSIHAQPSAFTYQGQLIDNGAPANGEYDLKFSLHDALSNGSPVGSPITVAPVLVNGGVFTVTLDFGAVPFIGFDRWLEINVRTNGSADAYATLVPRQAITSTPYATFARGVNSSGIIGQLTDSQIATTLSVARTFPNPANQFTGLFTGDAGGLTNLTTTSLVGSLALGLNPVLTGANAAITAGQSNTNQAQNSLLGAGIDNIISSGANIFLGAGGDNEAKGLNTFLGAGANNFLDANAGVLVGGIQNANRGNYSFLGAGGINNIDSGAEYAVIPGGEDNLVSASYGFAAGRGAQALHAGSFVWSDSAGPRFSSTAINQFLIRTGGGVGINKDNPQTALDVNGTVTATAFVGDGSGLIGVPAGSITGTLSTGQVPALDTAKVTSGTFDVARVPDLDAAKVVSGTLDDARISGNIARAVNVWAKAGNAGTTPGTDFIGTTDNQAFEVKVNNGRALRVQAGKTDGSGSPNLIGGYADNTFNAARRGAVIGGGGESGAVNSVGDNFATVSGGSANNAAGEYSVIGGGNSHSATANFTTIGGGHSHTVSGAGATVSGGEHNTASGLQSMVPGGVDNVAGGEYSLAAGRRANAGHLGAFVWADSTDADFVSTGNNQFLIRASGNVGINKNNPQTALDVDGTVTAAGFAGDGSLLSNLNAANLTGPIAPANIASGTIQSSMLASGVITGGLLTGFSSGPGTISSADSILSAIAKLDGNLGLKAPLSSPSFSGTVSGQNVSLNGTIDLPATTGVSAGVLNIGGDRFLHRAGTENTFLGRNAGNFSLTGGSNTGVGQSALEGNTTGFANTAIGLRSLFFNTTGSQNTAMGFDALLENRTGALNTAVGGSALRNNTASENTALGHGALVNTTTGSGNTALGRRAGENLTTGGNNICIGYNVFGEAADSNAIRIGNGQTRAFVAGIRNATTGLNDALPVVIDSNGQLGAVQPGTPLQIGTYSSGDQFLRIATAGGNLYRAGLDLRHFASDNGFSIFSDERGSGPNGLHFMDVTGTNQATQMFIENDSGNVGIGTTDPQAKLHVKGGMQVESSTTALDLKGGGAIKVQGAGVGSNTPVFIHQATSANTSGHITYIDNALCNGDSNAILIVTPNWSVGGVYNNHPIGVYYDPGDSKWSIFNQDFEAMPESTSFNVLVFKR